MAQVPSAAVTRSVERAMGRYLLDGEDVVVATHQHWIRLLGVLSATVMGLVLVVLTGLATPAADGLISDLAWWLWLILLGYALVQVLLWRHDWFVATDKRLLLTYGLVSRRVAMMPMSKVTDMSFSQSVMGRLLGYGSFVLESAGQEQALRQVDFIPDADLHYRSICAEIFGEGDDDATASHRRRGGVDDTDPYGIPMRKPGDYPERAPASHPGDGHRVVRAATVVREDGGPDAGWSISHEDAAPPQQVRPPGDRHRGEGWT